MNYLLSLASLAAIACAIPEPVDGPTIYNGDEKIATLAYVRHGEVVSDGPEDKNHVRHTLKTKVTLHGDRKFDPLDKLVWWTYSQDVDVIEVREFLIGENTMNEEFKEGYVSF